MKCSKILLAQGLLSSGLNLALIPVNELLGFCLIAIFSIPILPVKKNLLSASLNKLFLKLLIRVDP